MAPLRPRARCASAALGALALTSSSLSCGPPEGCNDTASCISPQLFVTACVEPQKVIGGELVGGVSDCGLDFGAIAVTTDARVRLTNPGIRATEFAVSIEDDADDAVELALVGETLGTITSGTSVEVVVRAAPVARGLASMTLGITTDAANLPVEANGTITVPVRAFSTAVFDVSADLER